MKENSLCNTSAHKDRIIHLSEHELKTLATTFEGDSNKWRSTRLVSIHASEILQVLEKLASSKLHVRDLEFAIDMSKKVGVAAVPGSSFFKEEENRYVRFHFAKKNETLISALDRLAELKSKLKK